MASLAARCVELPITSIRLDTDLREGGINSRKYGDTTLATEFKFKTLSEDKTDAIFEGNVFDEAYRTVIRSRLEERIADISHDTITDPHQHVQIGRDLNDTPVPGLTLNPNNFELSLNWREMYTRFYGEEMLYHQKLHDWVISKEIWTKGLAAKTERGEMDELDAFSLTLNAFGDASHESRKDARRARIKRQFREVGYEWDFEDSYNLCDEERILEGLKKSIQMASMADESDDEDASVEEASNSEETRQDTNNDDMENVGEEEE
jgi:hypothetical protein